MRVPETYTRNRKPNGFYFTSVVNPEAFHHRTEAGATPTSDPSSGDKASWAALRCRAWGLGIWHFVKDVVMVEVQVQHAKGASNEECDARGKMLRTKRSIGFSRNSKIRILCTTKPTLNP